MYQSFYLAVSSEERTSAIHWNFDHVEIFENPENNNKLMTVPKLVKRAVFGSTSTLQIQSEMEYRSGRRRSSKSIYCRYPLMDTNFGGGFWYSGLKENLLQQKMHFFAIENRNCFEMLQFLNAKLLIYDFVIHQYLEKFFSFKMNLQFQITVNY